MSEQEKKSPLSNFTPGQTFGIGLGGGILVLCTIGFFVLLGIMFKGNFSFSGSSTIGDEVKGPEKFSACLDDGKYVDTVKQDISLGASLGVNGTPATFVNGYLLSGALPYDMLKQVVDAVLAGQEPDFDFMKDEAGEIVKVNMPNLPDVVWKGNINASVSLVEFSDFECPYCGRFIPSIDELLANYSDKIRFTYRNFPLSFHPQAQKAAEAFECAKEQGKAFEMHDELFKLADQGSLSISSYKKVASELGLE